MPARILIADDVEERRPLETVVSRLAEEVGRLRRQREGALRLDDLVAASPASARAILQARRAAASSVPVLIEGEAGVGKETLARAIHGSGRTRGQPFAVIDCDARPGDAEVETWFPPPGRERGRAAGASGTLYLRGVEHLASEAQARLAAALDKPGHGAAGRPRLIAASACRLVERVAAGAFREDLFHWLNLSPIFLAPLRARPEDIAPLALRFLTRAAAEEGRPRLTAFSPEALAHLSSQPWPGNLRQLEAAIHRAVLGGQGDVLGREAFPPPGPCGSAGEAAPAPVTPPRQGEGDAPPALLDPADRPQASFYGQARLLDEHFEMRPFEAIEAEVIRFAVVHYRGRMSEIARRLGIGRSTLYRKLKSYEIAVEEEAA